MTKKLDKLRAQVERNLQGLRNILEFRHLTNGRYGALTREELEMAIAENVKTLEATQTCQADATGVNTFVAALKAMDPSARAAFIERFDNATPEEIRELLLKQQRRLWKRRIRIGGM